MLGKHPQVLRFAGLGLRGAAPAAPLQGGTSGRRRRCYPAHVLQTWGTRPRSVFKSSLEAWASKVAGARCALWPQVAYCPRSFWRHACSVCILCCPPWYERGEDALRIVALPHPACIPLKLLLLAHDQRTCCQLRSAPCTLRHASPDDGSGKAVQQQDHNTTPCQACASPATVCKLCRSLVTARSRRTAPSYV